MTMTQTHALFDPLMCDPKVTAIMSDVNFVRQMLNFEAALAVSQGKAGLIPGEAAEAISRAVNTVHRDELEAMAAALAEGTAIAGTPVILLVKLLTARTDEAGQPFVHWGATTQDVMDTALVLQLRDVCACLDRGLRDLGMALAKLARAHRDTPMVARTVMQHALPTTFGLKAAGWLAAVLRQHGRLGELGPRVMALQFGGAAGTLASLGDQGDAVARALASELGLVRPAIPWHAARDRIAEMATFCGLLCGLLGKIGRDVVLMMQTDVQEAFEPPAAGRGGSSTMPHKRNPVLGAVMIGAGTAAPGLVSTILSAQMHEHERAAGSAHAEWRTLPELVRITSGALQAAVALAQGLEVDPARMRRNLEATRGMIMAEAVMMALGSRTGRLRAHHLVEAACRRALAEDRHLREVMAEDADIRAVLDEDALTALFVPENYLGSAGRFVDEVLLAQETLPTAIKSYDPIVSNHLTQ